MMSPPPEIVTVDSVITASLIVSADDCVAETSMVTGAAPQAAMWRDQSTSVPLSPINMS